MKTNIQKQIEQKERELEDLRKQLPKDKIKIFEASTMKEAMKNLFAEGYFPATITNI